MNSTTPPRHGLEPPRRSPFVDPGAGCAFVDHFLDANSSTYASSGAGVQTIAMAHADAPGTVQHQVGAAGVDACRTGSGAAGIFFGGDGIEWTLKCRVRINTLSDGANNVVVRGPTGDNTAVADHVDGVYFEYDFATHGNHNWRLCCSSNSVRTKVDTGISAIAGVYQTLEARVSGDGLAVTATIDDIGTGVTITTNIPSTSARICLPTVQTIKQLGAGALLVFWDYYGAWATFNPRRP